MLPGRRQRVDFSRYFSDGYVHAAGRAEKLSTAVNAYLIGISGWWDQGKREKVFPGFSKQLSERSEAFVQLFGASSGPARRLIVNRRVSLRLRVFDRAAVVKVVTGTF